MTRLIKFLAFTGVASVYLMQAPCTLSTGGPTGGISLIPNIGAGLIPTSLTSLFT